MENRSLKLGFVSYEQNYCDRAALRILFSSSFPNHESHILNSGVLFEARTFLAVP